MGSLARRSLPRRSKRNSQGGGLRKFLFVTFVVGIALAGFAAAQQIDFAAGGGTLFSSKPTSASTAFQPPAEKGGLYPNVSLQYLRKARWGVNAEVAFRYKEGLYNDFQRHRPVLYDANLVYAVPISDRTSLDLMAGGGAQTTIFYNTFNNCTSNSGVCIVHVNDTHFAAHFGIDLRRYVWRNLFVRPEFHYYRVFNNSVFHSDNVARASASIGYSFGRDR